MGVFAGDVSVQKFPASIRFAVYIEFSGLPEGRCDLGGEIRFAGKQLLKLEGELDVGKDGKAIMVLPSTIIPFEAEGQFEVLLKNESGDLASVLSKRISIGDVPSLGGPPSS